MDSNTYQQAKNLESLQIQGDPKSLEDRMRLYEKKYSNRLNSDIPVIIRVDGKNFSKYTKQFKKPFDMLLVHTMYHCVETLANELQGFSVAYHQSDEVSFLINNKNLENGEICFGGKINKINSLTASLFSVHFNNYIKEFFPVKSLAYFDCRCFNVPKEDVSNYFLFRSKDWARNSVTMLGRHYFSHNELKNKNKNEVKNMLIEKNVFWEELSDDLKYGTFVSKENGNFNKISIESSYQKINEYIEKHLI